MIDVPGIIYNGEGTSLDTAVPDLVQEQVDGCPHGSPVTDWDVAPIVRV